LGNHASTAMDTRELILTNVSLNSGTTLKREMGENTKAPQ